VASIKGALDCEVMIGSKYPQQALLNQELEIEFKDKTYNYDLKNIILSNIYFPIRNVFLGRNIENVGSILNIKDFLKSIDYIAISGACLSPQFLKTHLPVLKKARANGVKIIINGGGMIEYTYDNKKAISKVRDILKNLGIHVFIARDKVTFDHFFDIAKNSFSGIDCGFFVNDYFKPAKLKKSNYVIFNFDSINEPKIETDKVIVRTHHSLYYYGWTIRLFSFLSGNRNFIKHLQKPNTIISELPADYLNLYANAAGVYSDRVHTCVASLIYNTPVKLYSNSPRTSLFDSVGAKDIKNNLSKLDMGKIKRLKKDQLKFLKDSIENN
jgi:hypothetical protein